MSNAVRIWQIKEGENLEELKQPRLDLESRLEDWIEKDISILSDNLMIIGRQVETAFGKDIDLLWIDSQGDLVILELKRDMTPRDTVAQAPDYASWVKGLSCKEIIRIGDDYYKEEGRLKTAFGDRFGETLPETLNASHRIVIVASAMDAAIETIVRYLPETYSVGINVAEFVYHQNATGHEFVSHVFLVDPDTTPIGPFHPPGKRKKPLTLDELETEAETHGVGALYRYLFDHCAEVFDGWWPTLSSAGFFVKGFADDSKNCAVLSLIPTESSKDRLKFRVYLERLWRFLSATEQDVIDLLPADSNPWKYYPSADAWSSGFEGYFTSMDDAERFVNGVTALKARRITAIE